MQRVHEDDLSGFLLDRETRTKYKHICIPATNEDGNIKRLDQMPEGTKSLWDSYLEGYKKDGKIPSEFAQGTDAMRQFKERVKEVTGQPTFKEITGQTK